MVSALQRTVSDVNEIQRYEFDRQGLLVIENLLTPAQVATLAPAVEALEEHAVARLAAPPRKRSPWGAEYHRDPDLGYHVQGSREEGSTVIIEDFWNADPAFDLLIGHQRTMKYVCAVIQSRATINNSEIRIRYRGNQSTNHGGTRAANGKYRYHVNQHGIDCMMVRMVYFLHDVSNEQGAFCVVPGTHKGNFDCPYDTNDPDVEPGVVGLEVKAGDARGNCAVPGFEVVERTLPTSTMQGVPPVGADSVRSGGGRPRWRTPGAE